MTVLNMGNVIIVWGNVDVKNSMEVKIALFMILEISCKIPFRCIFIFKYSYMF